MNRYILALCVAVLAFSSCGLPANEEMPEVAQIYAEEPSSGESTPEEPEPEIPFIPAAGGSIRIDSRNPKTFNPVLNEDTSVDRLLRLIYEPLIAIDGAMKPAPAIASSWEFSPDGLSLTLHVRQNAYWADGEPITAEDVKYTMDSIKASPETSLYHLCLAGILDYSAADENTLIINYEKPYGDALYNLTFPVIPKHHFSAGAEAAEPLGSGLYKLESFSTMREVRLSASDNSYRGKANIKEVVAVIFRDSEAPLFAYDRNIIDIVETTRTDWKKISATRQSNVTKSSSNGYEFLALNFRNPAIQNKNIRAALAHAVPKEEIISKIYAGNAFATDTPINPQSWLYEPNVSVYEYNTEKAKENLRLSAYSFPEGTALKIMVNNDNGERLLAAERIIAELNAIGIPAELDSRDFEDYSYRLMAGYFDIALCGFDMSLSPDLTPFFGSIGGVLGKYNFIAYKDVVMDGYLAQAELSVFETAQLSAYSNIQKRAAEELPYISLYYKASSVLAGTDIYGEINPSANNPYNNIGELYIRH